MCNCDDEFKLRHLAGKVVIPIKCIFLENENILAAMETIHEYNNLQQQQKLQCGVKALLNLLLL